MHTPDDLKKESTCSQVDVINIFMPDICFHSCPSLKDGHLFQSAVLKAFAGMWGTVDVLRLRLAVGSGTHVKHMMGKYILDLGS